ncbi:hypothetical protein R5R35_006038 [Gryllus longicercus]|uniref:Uncharacterized protein n=1 Tax=Gryllus longicercus TaxID=2509291 RepID=A0AAN9VZ82_9ORTH
MYKLILVVLAILAAASAQYLSYGGLRSGYGGYYGGYAAPYAYGRGLYGGGLYGGYGRGLYGYYG